LCQLECLTNNQAFSPDWAEQELSRAE